MAAAAILDFAGYQLCWYNQLWDLIFCPCVKLGANRFKNDTSYCRLTDFKMAAAAILNLLPVLFLSFGPL